MGIEEILTHVLALFGGATIGSLVTFKITKKSSYDVTQEGISTRDGSVVGRDQTIK